MGTLLSISYVFYCGNTDRALHNLGVTVSVSLPVTQYQLSWGKKPMELAKFSMQKAGHHSKLHVKSTGQTCKYCTSLLLYLSVNTCKRGMMSRGGGGSVLVPSCCCVRSSHALLSSASQAGFFLLQ